MRRLLFVVAMTACGARTEVRDAPAFDVVYQNDQSHLARWHSATGAVELLPTTREPAFLRCTRDGRFMAITDIAAVQFDVMDRNADVVRSHTGFAAAIRPDGQRLLVADADFPANTGQSCIGTLDADDTYTDVSCEKYPPTNHELFAPLEYSMDGHTVLWVRGVAYESLTFGTARDTADAWQPIVTVTEPTELDDAKWSPDETRIAFVTHTPQSPHDVSKLRIVRTDTHEIETLIDDARWIPSIGFTADGRNIVFVEADIEDGSIVSAEARMIDLGTHAIVPVAIPIVPEWAGSICVTSD